MVEFNPLNWKWLFEKKPVAQPDGLIIDEEGLEVPEQPKERKIKKVDVSKLPANEQEGIQRLIDFCLTLPAGDTENSLAALTAEAAAIGISFDDHPEIHDFFMHPATHWSKFAGGKFSTDGLPKKELGAFAAIQDSVNEQRFSSLGERWSFIVRQARDAGVDMLAHPLLYAALQNPEHGYTKWKLWGEAPPREEPKEPKPENLPTADQALWLELRELMDAEAARLLADTQKEEKKLAVKVDKTKLVKALTLAVREYLVLHKPEITSELLALADAIVRGDKDKWKRDHYEGAQAKQQRMLKDYRIAGAINDYAIWLKDPKQTVGLEVTKSPGMFDEAKKRLTPEQETFNTIERALRKYPNTDDGNHLAREAVINLLEDGDIALTPHMRKELAARADEKYSKYLPHLTRLYRLAVDAIHEYEQPDVEHAEPAAPPLDAAPAPATPASTRATPSRPAGGGVLHASERVANDYNTLYEGHIRAASEPYLKNEAAARLQPVATPQSPEEQRDYIEVEREFWNLFKPYLESAGELKKLYETMTFSEMKQAVALARLVMAEPGLVAYFPQTYGPEGYTSKQVLGSVEKELSKFLRDAGGTVGRFAVPDRMLTLSRYTIKNSTNHVLMFSGTNRYENGDKASNFHFAVVLRPHVLEQTAEAVHQYPHNAFHLIRALCAKGGHQEYGQKYYALEEQKLATKLVEEERKKAAARPAPDAPARHASADVAGAPPATRAEPAPPDVESSEPVELVVGGKRVGKFYPVRQEFIAARGERVDVRMPDADLPPATVTAAPDRFVMQYDHLHIFSAIDATSQTRLPRGGRRRQSPEQAVEISRNICGATETIQMANDSSIAHELKKFVDRVREERLSFRSNQEAIQNLAAKFHSAQGNAREIESVRRTYSQWLEVDHATNLLRLRSPLGTTNPFYRKGIPPAQLARETNDTLKADLGADFDRLIDLLK